MPRIQAQKVKVFGNLNSCHCFKSVCAQNSWKLTKYHTKCINLTTVIGACLLHRAEIISGKGVMLWN